MEQFEEQLPQQQEEPAHEQATPEHIQFDVHTEAQPQTPAAPVQAPTGKRRAGKVITAVVAVLALIGFCCGGTAIFFLSRLAAQEKRTEQVLLQLNEQIAQLQDELNDKSFTGNGNSVSGTPNSTADGSLTPGQVYAKVVDAVVAITCETTVSAGGQTATGVSTGSGFIMTQDGYIVTNYHVVESAAEGNGLLTVTTHAGESYTAVLRGFDSTNDLAVLKVEATGLPALELGSSDDLIVGDQVVVIGNPLGELNATLTVGYVSGKDRVISTDGSLINMLQTDAAVNSGNSGGPIFNMKGQVVGIITAKYSGTTNSGATIEGIGFAIPMDDVAKKLTDIVEYGYVTGAYLGVMVHDIDRDMAQYYGLPYGVYVKSVTAGNCAAAAGVQARDIITGLGGDPITCMNDLTQALQKYKGGETTTITVWRGGMELQLQIVLDAKQG